MLPSIYNVQVKGKLTLTVPHPIPILDSHGEAALKNNMPIFSIKMEGADFKRSGICPLTQYFVDKFIIRKDGATKVALSVLCELAKTTQWAKAYVLVDKEGNAILDANRYGKVCIEIYGNRTATRTITELADDLNISYGAVQKALKFWVSNGVMAEIKSHPNQRPKKYFRANGRPEKSIRYEFDPRYVWNGYNWLGAALDYERNLKGMEIADI